MSDLPTPSSQPNYAVELICCGHDDGASVFATAEEAHALRDSYVATPDHERVGIIRETALVVGNYTRGRWLESQQLAAPPVPVAGSTPYADATGPLLDFAPDVPAAGSCTCDMTAPRYDDPPSQPEPDCPVHGMPQFRVPTAGSIPGNAMTEAEWLELGDTIQAATARFKADNPRTVCGGCGAGWSQRWLTVCLDCSERLQTPAPPSLPADLLAAVERLCYEADAACRCCVEASCGADLHRATTEVRRLLPEARS